MTDTVVITGIARTPMGAFKGAFADVAAPDSGCCCDQGRHVGGQRGGRCC